MVMAKNKNPNKQPSKAMMVKAIVSLESGFEYFNQKIAQFEDVLRQYVNYKGDSEEFQKTLNETDKKRQEEVVAAKAAAASEHSGEQPEPSGGDTPISSE
jgi:predicted  nucleic acid-binding Zn-ribbon protein